MSIVIRNLQRAVKFNIGQLHMDISLLRKLSGFEMFDIGVLLVSDKKIKALNAAYRNVDEITDVLAFPYHEISPEHAGQLPQIEKEEQMLGDIALAVPYILSESQRRNEHFDSVILTMVTHGLCHLVGYDHETVDQWSQMHNKELEILNKFNQLTGHKCFPLLGVGHTIDH